MEWIDTCSIYHWRAFRNSYRKFPWVEFEPNDNLIPFRCCNQLSSTEFKSSVQHTLKANFVQLLQFHLFIQWRPLISVIAFVSCHICFKRIIAHVIILVAEWINTHVIDHWRSLSSSYRKLAWVRFTPTTSEFSSGALPDCPIKASVQLALRSSFVQLL